MSTAVISLWNRCIGAHYPMTERLFQQKVLRDPFAQREGNMAVLDDNRVVGWVLSRSLRTVPSSLSQYCGRGSIGALCVDPEYRRRGIGSRLYEQAEQFLKAQGAVTITVVHYPSHLMPGIPSDAPDLKAFFERRGFQEWHEAYDLRRQLHDYPLASDEEGYWHGAGLRATLRPARRGEEAAIMEFLGREFPGGWEYETKRYFDAGGEPFDILLAVSDDRVLGFCRIYTPESLDLGGCTHWFPLLRGRWGGLGPIGVGQAYRGRQLGLALLRYSVCSLRRRGVEDMAIDWTVLTSFYGQLGFSIWKQYWLGSKGFGDTT